MLLKYKTGKLPINYIALGVLLFVVSIWRLIIQDWIGIIYLLIAILFLFIESGFMIDIERKKLKKYTGLFALRSGDWMDISLVENLQIVKVRVSQAMFVISIRRIESKVVYKLIMNLPNRKLELMSGEKEKILISANEVSSALNITIDNRVKED